MPPTFFGIVSQRVPLSLTSARLRSLGAGFAGPVVAAAPPSHCLAVAFGRAPPSSRAALLQHVGIGRRHIPATAVALRHNNERDDGGRESRGSVGLTSQHGACVVVEPSHPCTSSVSRSRSLVRLVRAPARFGGFWQRRRAQHHAGHARRGTRFEGVNSALGLLVRNMNPSCSRRDVAPIRRPTMDAVAAAAGFPPASEALVDGQDSRDACPRRHAMLRPEPHALPESSGGNAPAQQL